MRQQGIASAFVIDRSDRGEVGWVWQESAECVPLLYHKEALMHNSVACDLLNEKKPNNWNGVLDQQISGLIYIRIASGIPSVLSVIVFYCRMRNEQWSTERLGPLSCILLKYILFSMPDIEATPSFLIRCLVIIGA